MFNRCLVDFGTQVGPINENKFQHITKQKTKHIEKPFICAVFLKPQPLQDELEINQKSIKSRSKTDQTIDQKSD